MLFALVCSGVAVVYGVYLVYWLLSRPAGSERMQEIARAVQEGAAAYLRKQYTTIAFVAIVPFLLLGFYNKLGWGTAIGFLIGATLSAAAGFIGMNVAVRSNVRTAEAAKDGLKPALNVAFRAGSVTGLLVVGLGLFGVAGYYGILTDWLNHTPQSAIDDLVGLAFGGSLISVFARLGRRHLHQGRRRRRRPGREDRGRHPRGRPAQPGGDRGQRRRQRRRLRRHGRRPVRDLRGHRRRRDAARHRVPDRRALALPARARRHLDPRVGGRHVLRPRGPGPQRDHQRALQGGRRRDDPLRARVHPRHDGVRRRQVQLLAAVRLGPHRPRRHLRSRRDHRVLHRHALEPGQVDRRGVADRARDQHHRGPGRRDAGDRAAGDHDRRPASSAPTTRPATSCTGSASP